jgi:valine--pyruvate aminotransferase
MNLSNFGQKLTRKTGILELMDDLGKAMSGEQKMLMLGGGNPAHIPEIEAIWRKRWAEIEQHGNELENMLGNYTTPQGNAEFISTVANFFKQQYGWNVSGKNVSVLNGSQTTFFYLFNMLAGESEHGKKKILLPIVPEYIGYADQGIGEDMFTAIMPTMEFLDDHTFKYHINFNELSITDDIAALCVSRPTNPTGNVITDEELEKLHSLAKEKNIPLIIDNAYGAPFPHILFSHATPLWSEQIIYVLTLSKIGLPSARTSIIIANEEITSYLTSINAIAGLSSGTIGQHLIMPLLADGSIVQKSKDIILPYYEKKAKAAVAYFHAQMTGSSVPYYLHKSEGALFLWLWCKDLPITSYELYQGLKQKGVLVVPGQYFYPGLQTDWKQKDECLRITYSQSESDVQKGLTIIAEEVKSVYNLL